MADPFTAIAHAAAQIDPTFTARGGAGADRPEAVGRHAWSIIRGGVPKLMAQLGDLIDLDAKPSRGRRADGVASAEGAGQTPSVRATIRSRPKAMILRHLAPREP
jgi:hypothetical protein